MDIVRGIRIFAVIGFHCYFAKDKDRTSVTYQWWIFAAADAQGDSAKFPELWLDCVVWR
jgi:hypothetical protein